jgi:hypothetical protein
MIDNIKDIGHWYQGTYRKLDGVATTVLRHVQERLAFAHNCISFFFQTHHLIRSLFTLLNLGLIFVAATTGAPITQIVLLDSVIFRLTPFHYGVVSKGD